MHTKLKLPPWLSNEARTLMLRAAKQGEPIMKKRGWNVRKLIEIIPPSP